MMQCLGEMATWLPLPGAIPQFCARYVDDALGFAVGWNVSWIASFPLINKTRKVFLDYEISGHQDVTQKSSLSAFETGMSKSSSTNITSQNWYASSMTLCTEISAASLVIQFWKGAENINVAAWITIIIVLIIFLNIFAIEIYGEAEFIFASLKIITIIGLLILAFILDLGGGPNHHRLGFQFWKNPGAMKPYDSTGNTGRFLGLFSTLVNAAFSYGGVELVAVAAGEAENPRKNIPKAVKRVFWRILFFYVLGSLAIGVLVAYNDPSLLGNADTNAAGSPWVIGLWLEFRLWKSIC